VVILEFALLLRMLAEAVQPVFRRCSGFRIAAWTPTVLSLLMVLLMAFRANYGIVPKLIQRSLLSMLLFAVN